MPYERTLQQASVGSKTGSGIQIAFFIPRKLFIPAKQEVRSMKKILALALVLILAMIPCLASANTLEIGSYVENLDGLSIMINGAQYASTYQGETSATHDWIIVNVTATNYATHTILISDQLSAKLVYNGKYEFDATPIFEIDEFEPLVRMSGQLVFRVPKMLGESDPAEFAVTLKIGKNSYPLNLSYGKNISASAGNIADVYFETPEEAILYMTECIQSADFASALGAYNAQIAAESYDLETYLQIHSYYNPSIPMPMDNYGAYTILNAANALPVQDMYDFVMSVLDCDLFNGGTGNMRVRDDAFRISEEESLSVQDWIDRMNPDHLAYLELKQIYRYNSEEYSTRAISNYASQGILYGYSDAYTYAAVYALNGKEHIQVWDIVRYPEGWKIAFQDNLFINYTALTTADLTGERWICTWRNGSAIEENLLTEVSVDPSAFIGTWYGNGYSITFTETQAISTDAETGEIEYGDWYIFGAYLGTNADGYGYYFIPFRFEGEVLIIGDPDSDECVTLRRS